MLKKLSQSEILARARAPHSDIEEGALLGLLEASAGGGDSFVSESIYDTLSSVPSETLLPWIDLFITRAFDNQFKRTDLFNEIADIYEMFGCPQFIRKLVYFETSDNPCSSEDSLFEDISYYVVQANNRLASWDYKGRTTDKKR